MATAETVDWEGEARTPNELEREIFKNIKGDLEKMLVLKVNQDKKHEVGSVIPVEDLTKKELKDFSEEDFVQARVATTAFGNFLFGKVLIPATEKGYFHFKAYLKGPSLNFKSEDRQAVLANTHAECIHTEATTEHGKKTFSSIFEKKDPLEFFSK